MKRNDKIFNLVKNNIKLREYTDKSRHCENTRIGYCDFKCPCKKSSFMSDTIYIRKEEDFKISDDNIIHFSHVLLKHIENQIRMNGSEYHINLLIDLIGKEEALTYLERWAKKNMIVALMLKKYIKKDIELEEDLKEVLK